MLRTFNNGLGLVIVVNEEQTEEVIERLQAMGDSAYHIGFVESREEGAEPVQFTD